MNETMEHTGCAVTQTVAKTDGPVRKVLRRIVQEVKPCTANVRYDVNAQAWAILDSNNNPIRHFQHGVMDNVKFDAIQVDVPTGCGSVATAAGIASGQLRENTYGSQDISGYRNLSFNPHKGFVADDGKALTGATSLLLLEQRQAMFKQ